MEPMGKFRPAREKHGATDQQGPFRLAWGGFRVEAKNSLKGSCLGFLKGSDKGSIITRFRA